MEIKQRVIQSGKGVRVELKTTSDAGVRFHDLTVEPLRDNNGAISGVIGTSSDITDRKNREQALRESEKWFWSRAGAAYLPHHRRATGWQVGVESAPGMGSTFWFTLPLAEPSQA